MLWASGDAHVYRAWAQAARSCRTPKNRAVGSPFPGARAATRLPALGTTTIGAADRAPRRLADMGAYSLKPKACLNRASNSARVKVWFCVP